MEAFFTIMPPKKKMTQHSAQQAFYYLTSFFALALVASGVGSLMYELIEFYYPQETGYGGFSQSTVRFGISTLVIAAPIYYFVTRFINRSISKKDLDADSGVRRWLTYIVMFIAVAVTLGDLIAVLNEYLDGTITIRFLLKALTIFTIAGGIFLYYFLDMNNKSDTIRCRKNNIWGVVYWVAVLVPLVWAFTIFETPTEARQRQIDENIIRELQNVHYSVESYASTNNQLPASFGILMSKPAQYGQNIDTRLLEKYGFEYRRVSTREYELCATFERDNTHDKEMTGYGYGDWNQQWEHPLGRHCFSFEIARNVIDNTTTLSPRESHGGSGKNSDSPIPLEAIPATTTESILPPPPVAPTQIDVPSVTEAPPPPPPPTEYELNSLQSTQ